MPLHRVERRDDVKDRETPAVSPPDRRRAFQQFDRQLGLVDRAEHAFHVLPRLDLGFDRLHRLVELHDAGFDIGLRLLKCGLAGRLQLGNFLVQRPFRRDEVRDRFQLGVRLGRFGLRLQCGQLRLECVDL